jgi:CDGSH-type Zn-finger protein
MTVPMRIVVSKDGTYIVTGRPTLSRQTIVADAKGGSERWQEGETFKVRETCPLCRWGRSGTKPFCDARLRRQ